MILAQAAQLPTSYMGLTAAMVGTVLVMLLTAAYLLREFQKARKAMATEVAIELEQARKALAVDIVQPFTVKPHIEYTPLEDHRKLAGEVASLDRATAERFEQQARDSSASRDKIYTLIRDSNADLYNLIREENKGTQERLTQISTAVGELRGQITAARRR